MAQERISILRMLEEGKISVDEATALLEVIEQPAQSDQLQPDEPPSASPDTSQSLQPTRPAADETSVSDLNLEKLTEMKIHGVTPAFIQEMHALGLSDLSTDNLVEMRIHGVTPDYVRQMEALGLKNLTLDRLIEMRIHGVDAEYLRTMKKLV